MKKFLFFLSLCFALHIEAQNPLSVQLAKAQATASLTDNWNKTSGLMAYALICLKEQYPTENTLYEAAKNYLNQFMNEDGSLKDFPQGELQDILPGRAFLEMAKTETDGNQGKYLNAAKEIVNYLINKYPRIKKNMGKTGFLHADTYPNQMWLQDFYDADAFYAQWLGEEDLKNKTGWTDIAVQFITYDKQAYNALFGLAYPHWSNDPKSNNAFWANKNGVYTGTSPYFTGQSTGYILASLADVLEKMPKSQAGYNQLKNLFIRLANGVLTWQDNESGCWYQLIDRDANLKASNGTANYLECSGTCLITYGLQKGIHIGLLVGENYTQAVEKAYAGICKIFLDSSTGTVILKDCSSDQGVGNGNQMSRDSSVDFYLGGEEVKRSNNEGIAIAACILALLEQEKTTK